MTLDDQVINLLVTVTLVEMMVAVGLGVTLPDLRTLSRDWRLAVWGGFANYLCVPAVTVGLLILFRPTDPMVSVGFLILAVCPGAPFAPACTKLARGNVASSVGLMVFLASSSAIVAPLLLGLALPWAWAGADVHVDSLKIVGTLVATQLLPLCVGLAVRHWQPGLAERIQKPANRVSVLLGLSSVGLILVVQFHLLAGIGPRGWVGMSALLIASCAVGWLLGGPGGDNRRAMALTTSLRNVGVGLVIATGSFAGTGAVTATLAYGIFEIVGSLLLALGWTRLGPAPRRFAQDPVLRSSGVAPSETAVSKRHLEGWGHG
jgi:BASS family bile acid:Na+ symporter